MTTISVSMSDEELAILDALAKREKRSRSNLIAHMAENWDSRTASPNERAASTKPIKLEPAGADGKLVYMMDIDPRTERPGSKFLLTWPDHLPLDYMGKMPWAYRPPITAVRMKGGKVKDNEKPTLATPEFILKPDDITDLSTPLRVYKKALVRTDHRANTPKTLTWVRHVWNEALGMWVADAEETDAIAAEGGGGPLTGEMHDIPKHWNTHRAYGAGTVEQLKELLTTLAADFTLSEDMKAFIGAGDEENEVA